jgi:anti-anti-sigma factor
MQHHISQKEKFTVLSILDTSLSANNMPNLIDLAKTALSQPPHNLIINFEQVATMDDACIEQLVGLQEVFYNQNASFVICCLSEGLLSTLKNSEFADIVNITPTESEAWDIVQMEEIERELLGGLDEA